MAHGTDAPNLTSPSASSDLQSNPSDPRPDGERRRFIAAGIAAAPLLVTLAARPASAQVAQGSLGNYGSATNP